MANEFKVRKGLVVNGSGSVILDVQGSQGQLFSVTDQLSGSLFSVNDISGVPVLEAFSDSTVKIGQYLAEAIIVSGSTARITGSMSLAGFSTGSVLFAGTGGAISQNNSNFFWDNANSRLGIGTNAPSRTLDIRGAARIQTATTTELDLIGGGGNIVRLSCSSTTPFIGTLTNAPLGFFTSATERGRFSTNGNFLLGLTSDSGERLQVSGSSRFMGNMVITGSGTTSATNALIVQNSSNNNIVSVRNDGYVTIHAVNSVSTILFDSVSSQLSRSTSGTNGLILYGPSNAHHSLTISSFSSENYDNGALSSLRFSGNFVPSSGATAFSYMLINGTINQTGTSANIVRGLYVNPTLTSATDFRAIEWSNNAATAPSASWGLYGAGTAPNFLSGSLGIGITTPSSSIHINSSTVNNAFLITTPNNNTTLYPFFIGGATLTSDVYLRANSSIIEFRRNGNPSTIRTVGSSNNLALEGSQHIVFSTNGANERARFTSGGNLLLNDTVDDTFNRLQVSGSARISQALTASLALISGSGSQRLTVQGSGSSILTVDGALGRLFSVDDAASGSLFSVNTISGLPIMEAFSDNTVRIGQFGQRALFVSQSRVGIGKEDSLNATLDVSGSMALTGSFNHQGNYTTTGVITAQTLVISTISSSVVYSSGSNVFGNDLSNTQVLTGSVRITGSLTSNGNVVIVGSGNTSATTGLTVQNSDGNPTFYVENNGGTYVRGRGATNVFFVQSSAGANLFYVQNGGFIGFTTYTWTPEGSTATVILDASISRAWSIAGAAKTATSGVSAPFFVSTGYAPTSGTGVYNAQTINPTINQTGGANGITRGLYVNPTLTAAWDFRAIEWSNNASATSGSWGLYGAGSAPNYLSGSLSIGTTGSATPLYVRSNAAVSSVLTLEAGSSQIAYSFNGSRSGFTYAGSGGAFFSPFFGFTSNNVQIGIGNADAAARLHVRGESASTGTALLIQNSTPSNLLTVLNNGNVLINSTTDDTFNRLQVSGSARISQTVTASQALISGSGTQRLTVVGSGSAQPLFTVQGSQGELFSIVDSLSGSLFSVNDQSGLPIMEVFSDNTILMGNYLDPMLLTTTKTGSAAGINNIYSLPTSSYDAVYIDYTIRSGSNARAGNFMAMWSGTSVNFTDNSITEFGSTSAFTFGAHVSGANMVVTGSAPTAGWTIKTIIKAI